MAEEMVPLYEYQALARRCAMFESMVMQGGGRVEAFDVSQVQASEPQPTEGAVVLQHGYKNSGPYRNYRAHRLAGIDLIIQDPKRLHDATFCTTEQFDYVCHLYMEYVIKTGRTRLFWDDTARASDAGNRCKLYGRHAVFLSLLKARSQIPECLLGLMMGIDQGTVSRYLEASRVIFAAILPTARNLLESVRAAYSEHRKSLAKPSKGPITLPASEPAVLPLGNLPVGSFAAPPAKPPEGQPALPASEPAVLPLGNLPVGSFAAARPAKPPKKPPGAAPAGASGAPTAPGRVPGILPGPALERTGGPPSTRVTMIIDGMHVQVQRGNNDSWRKANYSGKKKAYTYNTLIMVDAAGRILWISKTAHGKTHDLTLLRESPPDLGYLTELMKKENVPDAAKSTPYVDKGFDGLRGDWPGAQVIMPKKSNRGSDPETGGLIQQDTDYNREANSTRAVVEQTMGRIKQWGVMRTPYHDTPERFNDELNVVTGLVNMKTMRDDIKSKNAALIEEVTAWRKR